MVFLQNTNEGGTDETTVTTANSGGASGDAWTFVDGGGTRVFDTAQASHGSLSLRLATASGGSNRFSLFEWTHSAISQSYGRFYIRLSAGSTDHRELARIRNGAQQSFAIDLTAAEVLEIHNRNNAVVATGSTTLSINTWYRIEWSLTPGPAGSATVYLYDLDSATPLETLGPVTSDYDGTTVSVVTFGQIDSISNLPSMWFDSIAVSDTAKIQAYVQTVTATGVASTAAIGSPAVTASSSIVAAAVDPTSAVGTHTVMYDQDIVATGHASTAAVGTHAVLATNDIAATGVASTAAVGTHSAQASNDIVASGVASTAATGSHTVTASNDVQATGVPSTAAIGSHVVTPGDAAIVVVPGLASTAVIGTPGPLEMLNLLAATGVPPTAVTGLATIDTLNDVLAAGVASAAEVGLAVISVAEQSLSGTGVPSSASVGTHETLNLNYVDPPGTDGPAVFMGTHTISFYNDLLMLGHISAEEGSPRVYRPTKVIRPRRGPVLYVSNP